MINWKILADHILNKFLVFLHPDVRGKMRISWLFRENWDFPCWFLSLYTHPSCELIKNSSYLFADDTKLFRVIKSEQDIDILQDYLNKMIDWSDKWLLRFNQEKWKLLSINGLSNAKYFIYSTSGAYKIGRVERG